MKSELIAISTRQQKHDQQTSNANHDLVAAIKSIENEIPFIGYQKISSCIYSYIDIQRYYILQNGVSSI